MARVNEVDLVDKFLAEEKTLSGPPPEFGMKRGGRGRALREGIWPIANSAGIVETGQLRIAVGPPSDKPLTLAVIFRGSCVFRLDFVAAEECHCNPYWAKSIGLSPTVCGPHVHSWSANRDYRMENQDGKLPCREPLPGRIRRFGQALPWLADQIRLILTPEQREFSPPEAMLL